MVMAFILSECSVGDFASMSHALGEARRVRDYNEGDALLVVEFEEQISQVFGGNAIQGSRRFIGKEKSRLVDQGANHRNTLPLAAGKLSGAMTQSAVEPHTL